MHNVALDLLILLAGIWLVAVTLRPLGLPTVMGELIVGVLVGPAVFGWIEPDEAIQLLAEIGIFFLMFHAGVETQPNEFFAALKRSLGVAIAGAAVPFAVSFAVAQFFGLDLTASVFVGLIIGTATAVVITLKSFKDLGLTDTRIARIVVASCIINDLLTLIFFSLVIGALSGGTFAPLDLAVNLGKVVGFFAVALLLGTFVYPRLTLPFRSEGGKGFTFVLLAAIAAGLFAEAIGLHMILGAYLAGLFFEERVAHPNLVKVVNDRAYGIAYSFLGPIFFISLGFSISFDISAASVAFIALLAVTVIAGQVLSAGGMALRIGMPWREALTVGVGMCGRAEMAFILAALALAQGVIGQETFTILIFTAFLLNLFTPLALKGCSVLLEGRVAHGGDTHLGVFQIDKFNTPLFDENPAEGTLPAVEDAVVIYGYGPEVETLIEELSSRHLPMVVIEEDEATARQLQTSADVQVVHADLATETLDLRPLTKAKALVANGSDDDNALFALSAREQGFAGPIVAMIEHPQRRGPMLLAGATAAFTPNHVLAAAIAVRASARIGPRVAGVESLDSFLEVAELRVHDQSPLANRTLAETELYTRTGAHIVGQWADDALGSPPAAAEKLEPGTILVAVGAPESIHRLNDMSRPITQQGPIAVIGFADVGQKLVEILHAAGEEVRVVDEVETRTGSMWSAMCSMCGSWTARLLRKRASSSSPSTATGPPCLPRRWCAITFRRSLCWPACPTLKTQTGCSAPALILPSRSARSPASCWSTTSSERWFHTSLGLRWSSCGPDPSPDAIRWQRASASARAARWWRLSGLVRYSWRSRLRWCSSPRTRSTFAVRPRLLIVTMRNFRLRRVDRP